MRVGFTGSQSGMTPAQKDWLRGFLDAGDDGGHGDCVGSDADFHEIAAFLGMRLYIFPTWDGPRRAHCVAPAAMIAAPKDPLKRNADIVRWSQCMIATPSGPEVLRSGTWATVRRSLAVGRDIFIIMPDGSRLFR